MLTEVIFAPGTVPATDPIALPSGSAPILEIFEAVLVSSSGMISIADHPPHGHDITTVAAAGGGSALTEPVVAGPLESAGGGQTNPGAVDPIPDPQAHQVSGASGVTVIPAADIMLIDSGTFSFDAQATADGDLVLLRYIAVGSILRAA